MIDEADMDGDGEVNESEFLRIMKKTEIFWTPPIPRSKFNPIIFAAPLKKIRLFYVIKIYIFLYFTFLFYYFLIQFSFLYLNR